MTNILILRFLRLPASKRCLVLQILKTAFVMELGLRLLSFETLLKRLQSRPPIKNELAIDTDELIHLTERVLHVFSPQPNCLRKCLISGVLLRKSGLEVEIKIGVKKEGAGIHAHAWLEKDGVVITENEENLKMYQPLKQKKEMLS